MRKTFAGLWRHGAETVPRRDGLSLSPLAPCAPAPATPAQRRQPRRRRDGAAGPRGSGGTRPAEAVGEARRGPDPAAGLGQLSSALTSPPGMALIAGAAAAAGDGTDQERAAEGPSRGEPCLTCELPA